MRKFAVIFIALLCFEAGLQASHPILNKEGEFLTVMANSGLTLRTNPSSNSSSLDIIPFGESVKVINSSDVTSLSERIEWVSGSWILVEYDGQRGYVFDGYLAPFTIPQFDFEFSQSDLDLSYPLESWTDYHLEHIQSPDSILHASGHGKVIHLLEDGQKMIEESREHYSTLSVFFSDIRVMDAYHLLQTMIEGKTNREEFLNQSVFIEDNKGDINRIKINLENPVSISQTRQGMVKVSVLTPNHGCKL